VMPFSVNSFEDVFCNFPLKDFDLPRSDLAFDVDEYFDVVHN